MTIASSASVLSSLSPSRRRAVQSRTTIGKRTFWYCFLCLCYYCLCGSLQPVHANDNAPVRTRTYWVEPFVLEFETSTTTLCGRGQAIRDLAQAALIEYASAGCGLPPTTTAKLGDRWCISPHSILVDGGTMTLPRGSAVSQGMVNTCLKDAMASSAMLNRIVAQVDDATTGVQLWWVPVGGIPPTPAPTPAPTDSPTTAPSTSPMAAPTTHPTMAPTHTPTDTPTARPTPAPVTAQPTPSPTEQPVTPQPTPSPVTAAPLGVGETATPSLSPLTSSPTSSPTVSPVVTVTSGDSGTPTTTPTTSPESSEENDDDDDDNSRDGGDDDDDNNSGRNSTVGGIISNPANTSPSSSSGGSSMGLVLGLLTGVALILLGLVLWVYRKKRKGDWALKNQHIVAAAELDLHDNTHDDDYDPNNTSKNSGKNPNNNTFDMMEEAMSLDSNSGMLWHNTKALGQSQQQPSSSTRDAPVHNPYPTLAVTAALSQQQHDADIGGLQKQQELDYKSSTAAESSCDDAGSQRTSSSRLDRMIMAGRNLIMSAVVPDDCSQDTPVNSTATSTFEDEGKGARADNDPLNLHHQEGVLYDVDVDDASEGDLAQEPHVPPQPRRMPHNMASPTIVKSRGMTTPIVGTASTTTSSSTNTTPPTAGRSSQQQRNHSRIVRRSPSAAPRSRSVRMSPVVTSTSSKKSSINKMASPSPPRSRRGMNSSMEPHQLNEVVSSTSSTQAMVNTNSAILSPAAIASMTLSSSQKLSQSHSANSHSTTVVNVEQVQLRGQRRQRGHRRAPSPTTTMSFLPSTMMLQNHHAAAAAAADDMESDDDDRKSTSTFGDANSGWDYHDNQDDTLADIYALP